MAAISGVCCEDCIKSKSNIYCQTCEDVTYNNICYVCFEKLCEDDYDYIAPWDCSHNNIHEDCVELFRSRTELEFKCPMCKSNVYDDLENNESKPMFRRAYIEVARKNNYRYYIGEEEEIDLPREYDELQFFYSHNKLTCNPTLNDIHRVIWCNFGEKVLITCSCGSFHSYDIRHIDYLPRARRRSNSLGEKIKTFIGRFVCKK